MESVPTQEEIRRLSRRLADAAVEIEAIEAMIDVADGSQLEELYERRETAQRAYDAALGQVADARSRRIRALGIAL